MDNLILFNNNDLKNLLKNRSGESKFGKHIQILSNFSSIYDEIVNLDVSYVIFGIKEDIGVFANYGNTGASGAWDATLKSLLNIQSNDFIQPKSVLILGYLDYSKYLEKLVDLDQNQKKHILKARKKVAKIDNDVSDLMYQIIKAGKIPIVIGGGHNNAYGNIKGASLALKDPINVVNFDAHSDLRIEEGRHSGNGFTYALNEGFLKEYFIFGLHENYTSQEILNTLNKSRQIHYNTFEAIEIRKTHKFQKELENASETVAIGPFGIEFDCDAVLNMPSSAMTPSGFSTVQARRFINHFAQNQNVKYLHICEAAPTPETEIQIGKFITYLITDFIRAHVN